MKLERPGEILINLPLEGDFFIFLFIKWVYEHDRCICRSSGLNVNVAADS